MIEIIVAVILGLILFLLLVYALTSFLNALTLRKLIKQYREEDDLGKKAEERRKELGGVPSTIRRSFGRQGKSSKSSGGVDDVSGTNSTLRRQDFQDEVVRDIKKDIGDDGEAEQSQRRTQQTFRRSVRRRKRRVRK